MVVNISKIPRPHRQLPHIQIRKWTFIWKVCQILLYHWLEANIINVRNLLLPEISDFQWLIQAWRYEIWNVFFFFFNLTCCSIDNSIYSYYKNVALLGGKCLWKYYIYSYRQPNTQDIFTRVTLQKIKCHPTIYHTCFILTMPQREKNSTRDHNSHHILLIWLNSNKFHAVDHFKTYWQISWISKNCK